MKAVVCREHGLPDRLDLVEDWPSPELGDNDVRIRVKAAGLNFPDVLIIQGKYQMQPELPFIPGGECAGVVEEVGAAVTRWKVGDEVIHSGGSGSFCEEIVANELAVLPKPPALSFEAAAGITITYLTSYHALVQRANIQPGETMLVLGAAGGVGSTAVELGKALGATVIAAASSDDKLALCKELGADHTINYSGAGAEYAGVWRCARLHLGPGQHREREGQTPTAFLGRSPWLLRSGMVGRAHPDAGRGPSGGLCVSRVLRRPLVAVGATRPSVPGGGCYHPKDQASLARGVRHVEGRGRPVH